MARPIVIKTFEATRFPLQKIATLYLCELYQVCSLWNLGVTNTQLVCN